MKKEVLFITNLKYKNHIFKIYMINGKFEIKSCEKVDNKIIEEVKNILYDKNRIKIMALIDNLEMKDIKKMFIAETIILSGIFIGAYLNKDLDKIRYDKFNIEKDEIYKVYNKEIIESFDEELFTNYVNAVYSNSNLSLEDKREFIARFEYINLNKDYINQSELIKNMSEIKIIRHKEKNGTILGSFVIDENNLPVINLYEGATNETLIHEMYHAIKYNKYYWDDVYYYNNKFISSEEYIILPVEEKLLCEKKEILGNMIEEAHTSILTANEENTENVNISYQKEVYIYKMYEKILGTKNLEKNMLEPNQIVGFLNGLLEVGCTKEEAITFTARLDLYNTLTYSKLPEQDLSYLSYQICDDLAYVYNKKYGHTNDIMLNITILSITNNMNTDFTNDYISCYNMPQLYSDIVNKELTINNYLEDTIINNYSTKYGVNNIFIDYFSKENPQIIIEVNNYDKVILEVKDNEIIYKNIIGNSETSQYIYKLYTDYYEYATNRFNNPDYSVFYASIYANPNLTIDQKAEFVTYYENIKDLKLDQKELNNVLLLGDVNKIRNYFKILNDTQLINIR